MGTHIVHTEMFNVQITQSLENSSHSDLFSFSFTDTEVVYNLSTPLYVHTYIHAFT